MRPTLPPVMWTALSLWLGVVAAESLAWARWLDDLQKTHLLALGAVGILVMVLLVARRRATHALWPIAICGFMAGLLCGCLYWSSIRATTLAHEPGTSIHESGLVTEDPVLTERGALVRLRLTGPDRRATNVGAFWPKDLAIPRAGQLVVVRGSVGERATSEFVARRAHRRGEAFSLKVIDAKMGPFSATPVGMAASARQRLSERLRSIPGDGSILLEGMLIGEMSRLRGSAVEEDFRICGLSHLIAVSGGHLVIVAYLLGATLIVLKVPRKIRVLIVVIACGGYVALSGAQVSAVRSLIMGAIAALAALAQRREDCLGALAVAIMLQLTIWPTLAFSIGLLLSVAAVAGLAIFGSLASEWVEQAMPKRAAFLAPVLSATIVAQAATSPISVSVFNMLSVIGPIANILALPLVSVSLALGMPAAFVYLFWPRAGTFLLELSTVAASASAELASWLSRLPYAAIPLAGSGITLAGFTVASGIAIWVIWPRPVKRSRAVFVGVIAVVVVTSIALGPTNSGRCTAIALDVGQGDAILLKSGQAKVLVDTGAYPHVLREAIARHGVRRLDSVLITHDHHDHSGGLEGIAGVVRIDSLMVPDTASEDDFAEVRSIAKRLGIGVLEVSKGDTFRAGKIEGDVLWPPADWSGDDINDSSLIVRIDNSRHSMLLTGDAETGPLGRLLREGYLEPVCVLKVPHHGSAGGLSEEILAALNPRASVISVAHDNDYGHPADSTLGLLQKAGSRVFRTDRDAEIRICLDSGRVEH